MTDTRSNPQNESGSGLRAVPAISAAKNRKSPPTDSAEALQATSLPYVVAEWPKGRDTLRIMLSKYNGRVAVDVRAWYNSPDGDLKPGKSGVSVAVAQLPQLHDAIDEAMAVAMAAGWLEGGDA